MRAFQCETHEKSSEIASRFTFPKVIHHTAKRWRRICVHYTSTVVETEKYDASCKNLNSVCAVVSHLLVFFVTPCSFQYNPFKLLGRTFAIYLALKGLILELTSKSSFLCLVGLTLQMSACQLFGHPVLHPDLQYLLISHQLFFQDYKHTTD